MAYLEAFAAPQHQLQPFAQLGGPSCRISDFLGCHANSGTGRLVCLDSLAANPEDTACVAQELVSVDSTTHSTLLGPLWPRPRQTSKLGSHRTSQVFAKSCCHSRVQCSILTENRIAPATFHGFLSWDHDSICDTTNSPRNVMPRLKSRNPGGSSFVLGRQQALHVTCQDLRPSG